MHLSEILLDTGRFEEAGLLLSPTVTQAATPKWWRLADVMAAMGTFRVLNFRCKPRDPASRNSWRSILWRLPITVQSSTQAR